MALHTATQIEAMIKATGGDSVANGSETTWGHFDHVPFEALGGGSGAGVLSAKPTTVIANGVLTAIQLDVTGTPKGIGQTVITKGVSWKVAGIVEEDPDGGTIRLILANA